MQHESKLQPKKNKKVQLETLFLLGLRSELIIPSIATPDFPLGVELRPQSLTWRRNAKSRNLLFNKGKSVMNVVAVSSQT